MKKFLVYFGYLIEFLINTLPFTAPLLIIFFSVYLIDFLSNSLANGNVVLQILVIILVLTLILAPFWYVRLFQILIGDYVPKEKDGEYLTEFESGCLTNALGILLGLFLIFKFLQII